MDARLKHAGGRRRPRLLRAALVVGLATAAAAEAAWLGSGLSYVAPSAAELVPKSPEMMARVEQVKHALGDRLVSPQDAAKMVGEGAMLIDVRTPRQIHEMTESMSPDKAIVEPLDDWVKAKRPTSAIRFAAEFGRKIVVSCTAGPKSTLAWEFLKENGIDAYVVDGGFKAWAAADLPVQTFKFPKYQLK
mmetsp:Transcript_123448/g.384233  ORF Transcript_123448/g.384233 Transcript_123448/m.384233 type:complete len:190 (-) Transcript_123448:95-664(-)